MATCYITKHANKNMKRVRCPKCDNYITFDETRYQEGQSLFFQCPDCGKEFGIRIGVSKLHNRQKETNPEELYNDDHCGTLTVIENVFHYKQVLPLNMGGQLKYVLSDGPSYTGTFVDNEILGDRERRVLEDGSLFTIGATSIILRTQNEKD